MNIDHTLNSQMTSHNSPVKVSYGLAIVSTGYPAWPSQNSLAFPWLFSDHFLFFHDHKTYYCRYCLSYNFENNLRNRLSKLAIMIQYNSTECQPLGQCFKVPRIVHSYNFQNRLPLWWVVFLFFLFIFINFYLRACTQENFPDIFPDFFSQTQFFLHFSLTFA